MSRRGIKANFNAFKTKGDIHLGWLSNKFCFFFSFEEKYIIAKFMQFRKVFLASE